VASGKSFSTDGAKYATVEDGWMGIAFIEACVKSGKKKGAWTPCEEDIGRSGEGGRGRRKVEGGRGTLILAIFADCRN